MSEQKYVRVWDIKLARGWVAVTVVVHGPLHDENSTPANMAAVGETLARIGKALDRIQTRAAKQTIDHHAKKKAAQNAAVAAAEPGQ